MLKRYKAGSMATLIIVLTMVCTLLVKPCEGLAATYENGTTATVTGGNLRVRIAPGLSSKQIDLIKNKTQILISGDEYFEDNYTWVYANEYGGYVAMEFLKDITPPAKKNPEISCRYFDSHIIRVRDYIDFWELLSTISVTDYSDSYTVLADSYSTGCLQLVINNKLEPAFKATCSSNNAKITLNVVDNTGVNSTLTKDITFRILPESMTSEEYIDSLPEGTYLSNDKLDLYCVFSDKGLAEAFEKLLKEVPFGTVFAKNTVYFPYYNEDGTIRYSKYYSSKQCFGWAAKVSSSIFHMDCYGRDKLSDIVLKGAKINEDTISYDSFVKNGIVPGSVIRTTNNAYTSGHSIVLMGYGQEHVLFTDGNYDGKCTVRACVMTWNSFRNYLSKKSTRKINRIVTRKNYYDYIANTLN